MSQSSPYQQFSTDDFINDEYFQNWVFTNDSDIDFFWKNFCERHPHSREIISEARKILETVPFKQGLGEEPPSDEQVQKSLNRVRTILGFKNAGHAKGKAKIIPMKYWAAAASVVLLVMAGFYFFKPAPNRMASLNNVIPSRPINDIDPGGNKAILTLADGTKMILDSANNGTISKQGNITVIKLADGQLSYQGSEQNPQPLNIQYNTITTPRGGQYQLELTDGSRVWLNAESSLKFPTAFVGNKREVEITGEAYFEIAHDASKPFYVNKGNVSVRVLGTHFNMNSFDDEEEIKITLLEGSVKVASIKGQSKIITPGQQAQVANSGSLNISIEQADVEQVMAWKNGLFSFDQVGVKEVMKQLCRWYNVDVEYQGSIPQQRFGGDIQRSLKLSQVLEVLEKSGVHFKIDERKIIVIP